MKIYQSVSRGWARWLLASFTSAFFVFMLAPILIVVWVSFSGQAYIGFPIKSYSMRWFVRVFEYRPFLDALALSIYIGIGSTVLSLLLGVPASLALAKSQTPLSIAVTTFLLSPVSMPMIVLGFSLLFFSYAIGMGISFVSLLIAHTVVAIPYVVRTVVGVYRSQPKDFEEAAAILGASRAKSLHHVTLPLIRPAIFAGGLFAFLISLDNLPLSYFFGGPTTSTLPVVMLSYVENQFDPSIAAVSSIQMILALVAMFIVDRAYGIGNIGVSS